MFLRHHTFPFATGDIVIVRCTEYGITMKSRFGPVCPHIGIGVVFGKQIVVHRLCIIHLMQIAHRLNGKEDEFTIDIAIFLWQGDELAQRICFQTDIIAHHLAPFSILQIIRVAVEHFGCYTTIILATEVQYACRLVGIGLTKLLRTEFASVPGDGCSSVSIWFPCHVHKQGYGILHRFQVAHIQYPHPVYAIVISQSELFPHILSGSDVYPFGISWRPHIIDMIIQTPSALMGTFLCCRYTAHIAPVVITKQHDDIIRHTHSTVIIVQHLFI